MPLHPIPLLASLAVLAAVPDSYSREHAAWRKAREARLAAEGGWLSVVGLDWLSEGENRFGADPSHPVVLPAGKAPALAGVLVVTGSKVSVKAAPGAGITLDGQPVDTRELRTDADGKPDVLRLGSLAFHVIKRGDRLGVRLKDADSAARRAFKGIPAYAVKPAYRIEGRFVPYEPPKEIPVASVIGTTEPMRCPGKVVFRLGGREVSLEPVLESGSDELFFIFRDATSGRQTYPAGRFLYAPLPKDGKVLLDFNRAVNPPCAFTAFATCPLPPRQNWLPVPVPAGEKNVGHP